MADSIAPFTLPQTAYALSLASNALFGITDGQTALQESINNYLGGMPGFGIGTFFELMNTSNSNYPCLCNPSGASGVDSDWRTVWGPVAFQAPANTGCTNMMFVAHSPAMNAYVVAIAGTNPLGENALMFQDLDVQPADMVAWPAGLDTATPQGLVWTNTPNPAPTAQSIDKGTSDGLSRLYTMLDPGTGATVKQYLDSVADSSATLIFTGHSLGGALSPTLALLLYPAPPASPTAGVSAWANIFILPTAGPTPGTQGMADLFAAAFPPVATTAVPASSNTPSPPAQTFTYWNMIYANSYDVVPRAWNALADLVHPPAETASGQWTSFFAAGAPLSPDVGILAAYMVDNMQGRSGYQGGGSQLGFTPYYAPALPHVPFTGTWGNWNFQGPAGGPYPYPPAWQPLDVSLEIPDFPTLGVYILDAHLDQYSQAFLGFPAPKNPPAVGG